MYGCETCGSHAYLPWGTLLHSSLRLRFAFKSPSNASPSYHIHHYITLYHPSFGPTCVAYVYIGPRRYSADGEHWTYTGEAYTALTTYTDGTCSSSEECLCIQHVFMHTTRVYAYNTCLCIQHMFMHTTHVYAYNTCLCTQHGYRVTAVRVDQLAAPRRPALRSFVART